MADIFVDAFGNEHVVLSDLTPRREAPGKVSVRPPQKPEGLEEEGSAESVDLYLDRGTSLEGIMNEVEVEMETVVLDSESDMSEGSDSEFEVPAGFEAYFGGLLNSTELPMDTADSAS